MIAIDIPRKRIVFKSGLTDLEKYKTIKDIWYYNRIVMRQLVFPDQCLQWSPMSSQNIPDILVISQEFWHDK